jgi:predicted transcriptional regulator of viral defense system
MKSSTAMRALADIAETQHGLVTTAQAVSIGVPRVALSRLAERGDLERVTQGVYRIRGAAADSLTELRAAWLALDPVRTAAERVKDRDHVIAVSHRSAAAVHRIGNLFADEHQLTATERKQSRRAGITILRGALASADVVIAEGMLVTTVERTLADLARAEPNLSDVADALADAYRRDMVHLPTLVRLLDAAASRHGARDGADLLERMLEYRGLDIASTLRALVSTPWLRDGLADAGVAAVQDALGSSVEKALADLIRASFADAIRGLDVTASMSGPMAKALKRDHELHGSVSRLARQAHPLEAVGHE